MQPTSQARARALVSSRLIGAVALLAIGGIHLEQYTVADYRVIPTIGSLFLLNFIGGTALGLYLLVPARAMAGRVRRVADPVVAWSGLALAGGSLMALLISERTPLFGFMERGYRLEILIAIGAEAVAIVALAAFIGLLRTPAARLRWTPSPVGDGPTSDVAKSRNGAR